MEHNTTTTKAAKGAKGNFVSIDKAGAATIAAALLREYKSRQGIKAHGAELRSKYGADNWKLIDTEIKAARKSEIEAEAAMARAGVREWEPAIAEAWRAARKGGHFSKLANMAAAKYETPAQFIAATYPHVIEGAPAVKVMYVTGEAAATIVEAYELRPIDGRHARAIVDTCLGKMAASLKSANNGGKAYKSPAKAERKGAIVAAYNVKPGAKIGTIAKGEAITGEALAAYMRGNSAGLTTLTAYNAEAHKLALLAQGAEALAIVSGEAPKAKPEAKPKPRRGGKAAKAAREAMAQVEATIAAGVEAGRELSGANEREAKATAAAEAKARKIAMLAEA